MCGFDPFGFVQGACAFGLMKVLDPLAVGKAVCRTQTMLSGFARSKLSSVVFYSNSFALRTEATETISNFLTDGSAANRGKAVREGGQFSCTQTAQTHADPNSVTVKLQKSRNRRT